MASGLLALLDDIATLMDDTAVMTKLAAKKTAGIVGDDLAVNAEAMAGLNPKREIAIVAQVAKGSLVNKAILIPAALALAALLPAAIPVALMIGGAYLCYEGFHKVFDKQDHAHKAELVAAAHESTADALAVEKKKIRQAIMTDFVLSAEIVVLALGTMPEASLLTQAITLCVIALGMTVIVYGSVAGLVKLDDLGVWMMGRTAAARKAGKAILLSVPYIMKTLSVVGTAAMFLVGGEIVMHGIPPVYHAAEELLALLPFGGAAGVIAAIAISMLGGLVAGGIVATAWKFASPAVLRVKSLLPLKK